MKNFGFNLLATAQTVIGKQDYQLVQWLGSTTNDNGYEVDSYSAPIDRQAGVYPMSRQQVMRSGLASDKEYIQIFDVDLVKLLSRSSNSDKIIFDGFEWKAEPTNNNWTVSGEWNQVIAVKIGPSNA